MLYEILEIWRGLVVFLFGFLLPLTVAVIFIGSFLVYISK